MTSAVAEVNVGRSDDVRDRADLRDSAGYPAQCPQVGGISSDLRTSGVGVRAEIRPLTAGFTLAELPRSAHDVRDTKCGETRSSADILGDIWPKSAHVMRDGLYIRVLLMHRDDVS